MKKTFFVFTLAAALFGSHLSAQEARNALLIANGEYENIPSLSRPVKEGMDLKEALESIGFEVTFIQNANLAEMVKALSEFENKVKSNNGIALFHYGGHAIQFNKENYLIPVDAKTEYEMIAYTCVNVDEAVMKRMAGEANIVVLDSCRNDPFEEYMTDTEKRSISTDRGLAAVKVKSKSSIIIYSAQAGHTAQDGIFTPVFTEKITEKGKSLSDVITETSDSVAQLTMNEQIPAVYGRLMSIYLAGETAVSYDLKKTVATGSISVTSEFPGKIYLDGNYQSDISAYETVVLEDVATARYKLEIVGKNTNDNQSKYIVVKKDEESLILFKILTGSIEITSEIAGELYIDKQSYGKILSGETLSFNNFPASGYTVEVRGEESISKLVTVAANETAKVLLERKMQVSTEAKPAAPKKNIFTVKNIEGFSFGIEAFYNFSWFSFGDENIFTADKAFGMNIFPFSMSLDKCILKIGGGYTYSDSKIGKEALAFHEVDWLLFGVGVDFSRLAFTIGFGLSTVWEVFLYEIDGSSYKTEKPKFCMPVYVSIYFRIGKNLILFGEYKPTLFIEDILLRHSVNVGMRLDFYY